MSSMDASQVMINLGLLNLILTVIVNAATEARRNDKRLQADENLQWPSLRGIPMITLWTGCKTELRAG
eukprot:1428124-Amphidinium_carterae.1